jgi:glucosyl-dolichyl phosphate glucuronosyltransferase
VEALDATREVAVVVCAYTESRWRHLVQAVQSLQNQTLPPKEIVVVVDCNNALLRRVRQELSGCVAVQNEGPRGLSGARNSGIEATTSPVIAFLDDDAVAASDWIERLVEPFADPAVMGVGGAVAPEWEGERPSWFPSEFDWVVGCSYTGLPRQASSVRNPIGCNMAFRRALFDAIGGFTDGIGRIDALPVGCEETEFCIRARQRWPDRDILYIPDAGVTHHVPSERASWAYFFSRCFAEGRSKALVVRLVGADAGLSSERTYTTRTLPRGVIRGGQEALRGADPAGLQRGLFIVLGLTVTTAGYAWGRVAAMVKGRRQQGVFGHVGFDVFADRP